MRRAAVLALVVAGCTGTEQMTYEQALDPEQCASCHPDHVRQWSGSMHAFAADDPLFRAMNARGQRETNGELGDFCVQCHAPLALDQGLTTDGMNLADVPKHLRGVTCAYCHLTEAVEGEHNNPLRLSADAVMRGAFEAADGAAHESAVSPLHDRSNPESSRLCGACHDIVTPKGVHLEQTFAEWKGSLFAHDTPAELQTCGRCHMPGSDGVAADVPGVPLRRITDHKMVGVDVATIDWPEKEAQRAAIQDMLDPTVYARLCISRVPGGTQVDVDLENFAAGHAFPSGATIDRRVWVELRATLGAREIFSVGRIPEGVAVATATTGDIWKIYDVAYDAQDEVAHMFWDVERVEKGLLPVPTALVPTDPEYTDPHVVRSYRFDGVADRIEMNIHIRPVGLDVVDDLVASGDLDPAYRDQVPTFTLGAANVVWTVDDGETCVPD